MENTLHIKTAEDVFAEILKENEQLIKAAEEEEKKEEKSIDVKLYAATLRKAAENVDVVEKKEEESNPGLEGVAMNGMPKEPVVREDKAHDPPRETKVEATFSGLLDQGKIKEIPVPEAGPIGADPAAIPAEIKQPEKEITDGEQPTNNIEIKTAMDNLSEACRELYPESLEKDAGVLKPIQAGIKKIAPFLFAGAGGAGGVAGATAVAKSKREKELPMVYSAGIRRGYGAGARAAAAAYIKRFGSKKSGGKKNG